MYDLRKTFLANKLKVNLQKEKKNYFPSRIDALKQDNRNIEENQNLKENQVESLTRTQRDIGKIENKVSEIKALQSQVQSLKDKPKN